MELWKKQVLPSSAGALTGGLLFGVGDAALMLARAPVEWESGDTASALLTGGLAGAFAGVIAGGIALAALTWARQWRGRHVLGLILIPCAIGGCIADTLLYTHLYQAAHFWLGAISLVCAVSAGGLLFPGEHERISLSVLMPLLLLAFASTWLGPGLIGEGHRRLQAFCTHSTLMGRVARLWSEPNRPRQETPRCTWREMTKVQPRGEATGMNLLLVTVDAMRGDLAGEHLPEFLPKIGRRFQKAFVFERVYSSAVQSSRSDMVTFTGLWPHRIRFRPTQIDEQDRFHPLPDSHPLLLDPSTWRQRPLLPVDDTHPTLAAMLGESGYETVAVVPWLFFLPAGGITRGFETVDDRAYQERNRDIRGITSDMITNRALLRIGELPRDEPWFTWLLYMDAHAPYEGYGPIPDSAPARVRYLAELRRVDDEIDRLLDGLEADGRLERTIVVLFSDHGEEFREHGGLFHGTTVYEEQVRVMLAIFIPGRDGRLIPETVSLADVTPTLLDLLGIEREELFDGRSMTPLLRGDLWPPLPLLASSYREDREIGIIDGDIKLVENLDTEIIELYDLAADPRERRNLADDRPGLVGYYRCLLRASGAVPTR